MNADLAYLKKICPTFIADKFSLLVEIFKIKFIIERQNFNY